MVTRVPSNYRKSGDTPVTYTYTDIAEGTGKVIYYGFNSRNAGTSDYHLSTSDVFSNDVNTHNVTVQNTADYDKKHDYDFDILLNSPKIIKGDVYVSVTQFVGCAAGGGNCKAYIHARLRKWDGTTETEIANASGSAFTVASGTADDYHTDLIKMNVANNQIINAGETIRLTIEQYGLKTTSDGNVAFCHDPQGRSASGAAASNADTTKLQFHIPFKIT